MSGKTEAGKMAYVLIAVFCGLAATLSAGDTFYWIANSRTWAKYQNPSNWSLQKDVYSNPEGRIPASGDSIWRYGKAVSGDYGNYLGYFDLDGNQYSIAEFATGSAEGTKWKCYQIHLTNGSFSVSNAGLPTNTSERLAHAYYIYDSTLLSFPANGSVSLFGVNGLEERYYIKSGGRMEWRKGGIMFSVVANIESGGEMVFAPESFDVHKDALAPSETHSCKFTNMGTLWLPNGITWAGIITDNSRGKSFTLNQVSGTLHIGGDFTKTTESVVRAASMCFNFSGGTMVVTNSVAFRNATVNWPQEVFPSMPDGASGTVEVCNGSVLDMQLFRYGMGTSLVKTGPGTLVVGDARPASLAVNAGTLRLATTAEDLSGITFAAGSCIELAASFNSFDAPAGYAGLDFALDTASGGFSPGVQFLTSSDAEFLAHAKTCIEAHLPEGYEVRQIGDNLYLDQEMELPVFSSDGELSISDASGWGGAVPGSGDVIVSGGGTVALVGSSPAFDSITVMNGATLKVTGSGVALPQITISYPAKIVFAGGSSCTADSGIAGKGTAYGLPVVEIATNATLKVPRGTKFKNLDFRLYGRIEVPDAVSASDNTLVFGHAAAGEKSYFAMTAIGGTIYESSHSSSGVSSLSTAWRRFLTPEPYGRVVAVGPITLKDVKFLPSNYFNGIAIGYNNPDDEQFEVVLDGTVVSLTRGCFFGGAATVRCINGGGLVKTSPHPGVSTAFYMRDKARFVAEGAGTRICYSNADRYHFNVSPGYDAVECFTLKDGAYMSTHESVGNGRACLVVSNASWRIPTMPYVPTDNNPSPPGGDPKNWMTNSFNGFKSVRIEPNSTMYLMSAKELGGTEWNRDVKLADVPITGGGSLVMTNGTPGYTFRATVTSGGNTATGVAKAVCGTGGDETTLLFGDGANWAGTVVAGNVALTNVTDGAAPATATFGTLRMDGDFPVRVWPTTNDMVNITTALLDGGGTFSPVAMSGRGDFVPGESFRLGTYPANAEFPARIGKWRLSALPGDSVESVVLLLTFSPRGMAVVFR